MAESKKLVRESRGGAKIGSMGLGMHGGAVGSPAQTVYDGDTLNGRALANVSVRFLGVDTPELKIPLPSDPEKFVPLIDPSWQRFLADRQTLVGANLSGELVDYLGPRLTDQAAMNHHEHGKAAEKMLEQFVSKDIETHYAGDRGAFEYFLYYAHEAIDRYGRFLGFINVSLPNVQSRPPTYNDRQLESGAASPYFIWPNVDPFLKGSILDAAFPPSETRRIATAGALGRARQRVADARQAEVGIYAKHKRLLLEAFEIRFLARQTPPDRWVIDLSSEAEVLIEPERYFTVERTEDRLFVPAEYVPLFVRRGWQGADQLDAGAARR